jgi:hypothetical protein
MKLKEHLRLFWHLRNGIKISDAKCKVLFEVFLGWGSYENPRENQVFGFVSSTSDSNYE